MTAITVFCRSFFMIFTNVVSHKEIDASAPDVCGSHICLNHRMFYVINFSSASLVIVLFRNLVLLITCLGMCLLAFLEESPWTSGPARPTRPLWHPRVRWNRCEYLLGFTLHILCYKDNHCTGAMANLALLCSSRGLPVGGGPANENTPTQKALCSQQREGSLRRVPLLSPRFVSQ